jgi:hypothetical protein
VASTPEARMKGRVNEVFKAYGVRWVDIIGSQYATNGISDKLTCVQGRFFAVEVKAGDNMPTALQIKYLREVHDDGGVALVINEKNISYLGLCLEFPKTARSNYEDFITPAVRAALMQNDDPDQPKVRSKK